MKSRHDLADGEKKIEVFLTHLAVKGNVAPATQNQAMNALVFLYRKVLKQNLDGEIHAVRATKKQNIPAVMTEEETIKVLSLVTGTPQLVAKLLYGSGLRMSEAVRLRIQDIDYEMKALTVRSGKGNKDRVTTLPTTIIPFLKNHLNKVKIIHQNDIQKVGKMSKRIKTSYPGVYYREARRIGGSGTEKVYHIVFKKDGKVNEEKAGRDSLRTT